MVGKLYWIHNRMKYDMGHKLSAKMVKNDVGLANR